MVRYVTDDFIFIQAQAFKGTAVEMGRFLLTDCKECGEPQISVNCCEFDCFEGACDFCYQQVWRQCPECGRTGCKEHFDGMYCHECIAEANKEAMV